MKEVCIKMLWWFYCVFKLLYHSWFLKLVRNVLIVLIGLPVTLFVLSATLWLAANVYNYVWRIVPVVTSVGGVALLSGVVAGLVVLMFQAYYCTFKEFLLVVLIHREKLFEERGLMRRFGDWRRDWWRDMRDYTWRRRGTYISSVVLLSAAVPAGAVVCFLVVTALKSMGFPLIGDFVVR